MLFPIDEQKDLGEALLPVPVAMLVITGSPIFDLRDDVVKMAVLWSVGCWSGGR